MRERLDTLRRGRVGGITADRMAEVAEVDADLIGAAGDRDGLEQAAAVLIARKHAEMRQRLLTAVLRHAAGAGFPGHG